MMRAHTRLSLAVLFPALVTIVSPVLLAQTSGPDSEADATTETRPALMTSVSPSIARGVLPNTVVPGLHLVQSLPHRSESKRLLWCASLAALAAASFADAHSSWGKHEANGMLSGPDGRFGAKGAAIKGGVSAAWIVSQVLAFRNSRSLHLLTATNLGLTALFTATAIHNYQVRAPAR